MKFIKHAMLGLALSTCAAFASAVPMTYYSTAFVWADMSSTDTDQTFNFGSTGMSDYHGNLISANAGDSFVYDYLFNTPPPAANFNFLVGSDSLGGITFTDAAMLNFDGSNAWPFTTSFLNEQASGSGILNSGLYDLRLSGTFNAALASFTGSAEAELTNPVPEPMSLGLMGAGLAGLIGARRRKAGQAAKAA